MEDKTTKDLIGEWTEENCPKCGAKLLKNKLGQVWCSNAGGNGMSPCEYGLKNNTDDRR